MQRLRRRAAHAEEFLAGAGFVAVILVTVYNIINRYVFQGSAAWAPELAGILFSWVVFLGASAAWKRGMHVSIDIVVTRLSPRVRTAVHLCGQILLAVFFAYATWLAAKIMVSSWSRETPVMHVPFSFIYASAVFGFGMMGLRTLGILLRELRGQDAPAQQAGAASLPF